LEEFVVAENFPETSFDQLQHRGTRFPGELAQKPTFKEFEN
jgi:hypothetical protein